MLEGLDKVDWSNISHSHGPANEVPNWIKDLTSKSSNLKKKALENINDFLCHQGSVYPASLYAVPFFIELLNAENIDIKIKIEILDLIRIWADGAATNKNKQSKNFSIEPDKEVVWQLHTEQLRKIIAQQWERNQQLETNINFAASKGIDIYLKLLEHHNSEIRRLSVLLLTCFWQESSKIVPYFLALLKKEKDKVIITCILSGLGVLAEPEPSYVILLQDYFIQDEQEVIKLAAAIAWLRIYRDATPKNVIDYLLESLELYNNPATNSVSLFHESVERSTGNYVIGDLFYVLTYLGPLQTNYSFPILIQKLGTFDSWDNSRLAHTLMTLIFKQTRTNKLTDKQKVFLQKMADDDNFWQHGVSIVMDNLFQLKIPYKREELQKFLEQN